jgi:hypothetical protein
MQLQSAGNLASRLWQRGMRDRHSQIVTIGLLFMACYLPTWLGVIGHGILEGKSDSILNFGFIFLGLQTIHAQRNKLKSLTLGDKVIGGDDRAMGYGLMLLGIITRAAVGACRFSVFFPFRRFIYSLVSIPIHPLSPFGFAAISLPKICSNKSWLGPVASDSTRSASKQSPKRPMSDFPMGQSGWDPDAVALIWPTRSSAVACCLGYL